MVKLLLSKGADPNILDNENKSPLYAGITPYKYECAAVLLKNGSMLPRFTQVQNVVEQLRNEIDRTFPEESLNRLLKKNIKLLLRDVLLVRFCLE